MMISKRPIYGLVPLIAVLGACGEASNNADDVTPQPAATFAGLAAEAARLDVLTQSLPRVQADNIPDTGTVSYDGVVTMNTDTGPDLIGDLTLEAAFMTSGISGGMTNIINEDDEAYTGSLNITGDIVRTGDTNIDALLSGTINNETGELTTVLTTMRGEFRGLGTEAVSGTVEGNIIGGDYGSSGAAVDGTFDAERQ